MNKISLTLLLLLGGALAVSAGDGLPVQEGSRPAYVKLDSGSAANFHGNARRWKIDETKISAPGKYYFGTVAIQPGKQLILDAYFWGGGKPETLVLIEESADGQRFTRLPVEAEKIRNGLKGNAEYFFTNAKPFSANAKTVRIGFKVTDPKSSWKLQLCGIRFGAPQLKPGPDVPGFVSRSTPGYVRKEVSNPGWYNGVGTRWKIDETKISAPGKYYFGTVALNGRKSLTVTGYCWAGIGDPKGLILVEESRDGKTFSPATVNTVRGKEGLKKFTEYVTTAAFFEPETKFVRIGFWVKNPKHSWAFQFCGVK